MSDMAWDELESAEDFLDYLQVPYERRVVEVNRLHILQRFHDYIAEGGLDLENAMGRDHLYRPLLAQAYQDFVGSDAQTERVFRVFSMGQAAPEVSVAQLLSTRP